VLTFCRASRQNAPTITAMKAMAAPRRQSKGATIAPIVRMNAPIPETHRARARAPRRMCGRLAA
jgi:hypothetical protein